jgi:hypothetical protein
LLAAGAIALVAVLFALSAHDTHAWERGLADGDAAYATQPVAARWRAGTWLAGDPAGDVLQTADDIALRRAVQAFVVAADVGRGFDNGERRSRLRARADVALSGVVATGSPTAASQAANLAGVLAETAGSGGERGRASFEAAVRADPANTDAAFNLELLLRRARATGVREGPGTGTGTRGSAERGAGSGTPGQGY